MHNHAIPIFIRFKPFCIINTFGGIFDTYRIAKVKNVYQNDK